MERYGDFGSMFEMSRQIRENLEFRLDETDSEWLKKDIRAFMEKYDVEDWDEAIGMYATHNVLPEEKVRAALGESIFEQDEEEEDLGPDEGDGMEDLLSDREDGGPEDEEEEIPEEDFIEDTAEIPVPEDKEYVGKSDDKHFYMVPEKNDQGEIIDMKIVDQEENELFSAEENGIEPTDMSLFLNTVFRDSDVGIAEIDRQVIVKYVIPAAEQEQVDAMEDEEEDLGGGDLPGDEEEMVDDEFAEDDEFAVEDEEAVDVEDEEMDVKKKKKDELLRPMESRSIKENENKLQIKRELEKLGIDFSGPSDKLSMSDMEAVVKAAKKVGYRKPKNANGSTGRYFFYHLKRMQNESKQVSEKQIKFDGETFDVQLVDEGSDRTTISVNGKEFNYTSEFASMFQDDEGTLTESGLEELAMDALSTLDSEEFSALAEGSEEVDEELEDEEEYDSQEEEYDSQEEESDVEDEPQEDDIFLSPVGHLGGQTQVSTSGKVIGTFSEESEAREAARQWMETNKYYPNVWVVSDHGNHHRITLENESKEEGNMKKAKESKVEEQGEFKHVFLVKYTKDDGEKAEMRVEALDANDAKMMIRKRKGVKDILGEPTQIGESRVEEALSRKYYIQFADMLKGMENREEARAMANRMAEMFRVDNPRFDNGRFMAAAGVADGALDEESESGYVNMVGFYVGDVLLGAVRVDVQGDPWSERYWPMEWREEDFELVSLVGVPGDLAVKLENQGSSNQDFSDGHKAASAAAPYVREEDSEEGVEGEVTDEKCGKDVEEEVEEGEDAPGKRDGTGPHKGSRRAKEGMRGMRKSRGEKCPMESKVVFPANDKRVRDGKSHFPITSENLATRAMERVAAYTKAPAWFDGKVEELQEAVRAAVAETYSSIKIEESEEKVETKTPKKLDETVDSAFGLAQELLGLNESVDEMDEIKVGTYVHIMSRVGMRVMHESVKVAQVNEHGVEVTGNEAEVDQEWFTHDTCHIYPV